MTLKKYFIAIILPEPVFTAVEAIKQQLYEQHGLKGALRSPAHITLHRPFEWKEEKEEELIKKISDFRFSPEFTEGFLSPEFIEGRFSANIVLKDFAFFEPRVIYVNVLPNEQLDQLHSELTTFAKRELRLFNEAEDLRGFHPHVTVAFRDLKKPMFYTLKKEFENRKLEATFDYKGFSLLRLEKKWEEIRFFEK